MAVHRWTIETPTTHTVEVQHAIHSGRVKIKVDGVTVFSREDGECIWDAGLQHEFTVDGKTCRMGLRGIGGKNPEYELKLVE